MTRYVTDEAVDPRDRFALYRLCNGDERDLQLVCTCATPEAVGLALVTLGREGEWDDCPVGCLDRLPEPGQPKWIMKPWKASPREVSAAGRVLQQARKGKT